MEVDPEAEVVLFGSRARGDFHDESDWDDLILVDKEETDFVLKERFAEYCMSWNWSNELLFPLSLLIRSFGRT